MTTFDFLLQGLAVALVPTILLHALIGVSLGTGVAVLPGIGPALTVALLLLVTYGLDPAGSLIMFAGIYYGGMYGGSTASILLNTPGESASIVTALEGNKMARQGRGGPALATAAIGSFVAGLLATLMLAFIAPTVVQPPLVFGPRDCFALMVRAFVTVSSAFGDSARKGLISLFIGLALALVGIDQLIGQARLFYGVPRLLDSIEVTTLAVALFAVGEALFVAGKRDSVDDEVMAGTGTATAAIMLAGFQQFGLQPGPLLFATNPQLVWGLIASLLTANLMLLMLNLPLVGLWVRLLTIPRPWLYAGILAFATLGTIGANPSLVELSMLLVFGIMGYGMRLYGYPIAPVVVGLILGPMAEQQLRRALAISQSDLTTLIGSPVSATLLTLSALALIVPLILRARGKGQVLNQLASDED